MSTFKFSFALVMSFVIGYSTATSSSSEPLTDVSQYEVATPIYSH